MGSGLDDTASVLSKAGKLGYVLGAKVSDWSVPGELPPRPVSRNLLWWKT